jgi:ribosomal protein L32
MAVPKKKVTRSRRNMRRFSAAYELDPVTVITSPISGDVTRPHRVTVATAAAYVEARNAKKAARGTASKPASK